MNAANGIAHTVSPMLEAGSVFNLGNGMTLRGFVSGGVAFSSQNAWPANASLQGTVPEAGTFQTTAELPNERFKLNGGIDLVATKNLDVRLEYRRIRPWLSLEWRDAESGIFVLGSAPLSGILVRAHGSK